MEPQLCFLLIAVGIQVACAHISSLEVIELHCIYKESQQRIKKALMTIIRNLPNIQPFLFITNKTTTPLMSEFC